MNARSWIEPPRDVEHWSYQLAESFRHIKNRREPAAVVESPTYYMAHIWNFYPSHMTFAFADSPDANRDECRFYTWRW